MVELDFTTGAARGLSGGAREAVRRSGRLPSGLVHPAVEQAWAAVNAAKAFEGKSATVADIVRARDGGWQVGQTSGWGAFGVKMSAPMPNDPECDCGWSAPVSAGDGCGEKVTDEHGEQEESKRTSESFYSGSVSGAGRWVYKNSKCEFEYSCDAPCGCYEKGGDQELVGVRSGVSSHCLHGSAAPCPDVDYHVVYDSGKGKCLAYAQCMKEGVPCGEAGKGWFPWGPEMAPCPKAVTSSMSAGTRDPCGGTLGHAEDLSPATVGDARWIGEAGLWHDDDMRATTPLGALLGLGGCAGCSVKTDPGAWDCAIEKQADKYAAILPRTCGCAFYLDHTDPLLGARLYKFCSDLFPPVTDFGSYLHTVCMANIFGCVVTEPDRTKEQLEKYCPCPDFSPPGPDDLPDFSA